MRQCAKRQLCTPVPIGALGIGLGVALAQPTPAGAQAVQDYDACVALIASDPARAEREAGDWARFGGGAAARHCYALALIELGAPLRASDELIGIALDEVDLPNAARADILVQAGELLLEGGVPVTAGLVAEQAAQLAPAQSNVLALRAAVNLENGQVRAALRDLDRALAKGGGTVRLRMLRASAHRRLANPVAGRDDATIATEQAPDNPAAWLERGRNEAALGAKPAARKSFLRAIELDREGKIGASARLALQRMDAGLSP